MIGWSALQWRESSNIPPWIHTHKHLRRTSLLKSNNPIENQLFRYLSCQFFSNWVSLFTCGRPPVPGRPLRRPSRSREWPSWPGCWRTKRTSWCLWYAGSEIKAKNNYSFRISKYALPKILYFSSFYFIASVTNNYLNHEYFSISILDYVL